MEFQGYDDVAEMFDNLIGGIGMHCASDYIRVDDVAVGRCCDPYPSSGLI